MTSRGECRRELRVAAGHGVVVLAMALGLFGQMAKARALDVEAVCQVARAAADTNAIFLSSSITQPLMKPVRCGPAARPVPPWLPGEPPAVTEDTGDPLSGGAETEAVDSLQDLCPGCGCGVGLANLGCFGLLCVLGLACTRFVFHRR